MGRHKKGDPNVDSKSIKQGLATIIRSEYRTILIPIISRMAIEATKIACLASLLLLMMVSNNKLHFHIQKQLKTMNVPCK